MCGDESKAAATPGCAGQLRGHPEEKREMTMTEPPAAATDEETDMFALELLADMRLSFEEQIRTIQECIAELDEREREINAKIESRKRSDDLGTLTT